MLSKKMTLFWNKVRIEEKLLFLNARNLSQKFLKNGFFKKKIFTKNLLLRFMVPINKSVLLREFWSSRGFGF